MGRDFVCAGGEVVPVDVGPKPETGVRCRDFALVVPSF
ncbi:hypothetical protein SBA7_1450002 [Candidatus Sulfotelmatobacter sp. SbA7]|nr:hypothetical protein SBA7_1450002 [Candidatus Sulfotelmatobacter sp. SbA7]